MAFKVINELSFNPEFYIVVNSDIFKIEDKVLYKNEENIYSFSGVIKNFIETTNYLIVKVEGGDSFLLGLYIFNKEGAFQRKYENGSRMKYITYATDKYIFYVNDDSLNMYEGVFDLETGTSPKTELFVNAAPVDEGFLNIGCYIYYYDEETNLMHVTLIELNTETYEPRYKLYTTNFDFSQINYIKDNDIALFSNINSTHNLLLSIPYDMITSGGQVSEYYEFNEERKVLLGCETTSVNSPIAMSTLSNNGCIYKGSDSQKYSIHVVENTSRNITINYKVLNSEEVFYTSTLNNITKPITKIEINTTLVFSVKFYESDGREYPTSYSGSVGGEDILPYIESYNYKESTYLANKLSTAPTEISTNDSTEEITIIFNVGENYHYKIQFVDRSVSPGKQYQVQRLLAGSTPVYSGATPTKEGYTFTGWNPALYPADKDQDYNAVFEVAKIPHTITFEDSNDEPFITFPSPVTFNNNLTRILFNTDLFNNPYIYYEDIDGSHTINFEYTNKDFQTRIIFNNIEINDETYSELNTWYDINITGDVTIQLNTSVQYYIEFRQDSFTLSTLWCNKGDTPTYNGTTPTKTGYDFIGWEPEIYAADKPQVYKATFKIKTFTIRFLNDDGSVLETQTINYGTTPTYTGETPTKQGYNFNGWSPTLYPANKNQDYTATYRKSTFAITLYQNSAENNRIDKTEYLTSVGEIEGYLRQETNIINPTIVIEYNKVIDFNYIYISTFNRYYFVNRVSSVRSNLWRIELSVDVLMTYKETILNYECFVARNENTYDAYIEDKYLPLKYEKEIEYIEEWASSDTNSFFKGYTAIITTIASNSSLPKEENIEITTPFEDGNGNVATTSTFETGSSNFKVVQFIPDSSAYGTVINRIAQEVIGDDKVASYILSFIVFPIWNPAIYNQVQYESGTKFYYGESAIDMTELVTEGLTPICVLKGDTIAPIYMRSFSVPQHYNSFLDYEPYSTYELWLPFHGWVKLNATLVVGKLLAVYYIIQPDSTKGTILVKNVTDGVVALEVPCDIGVEIAVNSTNAQEIANRKNAAAVGLGTSAAIGVAASVLGMATMNPFLIMGGVASMVGGVSNFVQQTADLRTEGKGSVNSGNEGLYSDRIIKLKITRTPLAVDDLTKYAKYIGRPLQTNVKLNTLTGYTIVGGVHIENLPQATENEKQEIEKILRQGFII